MTQRPRKKRPAAARNEAVGKRLIGIETSLSEMESQMHEAKETMNKIENILAQLNQPVLSSAPRRKKRTAGTNSQQRPRRRISLFPTLRRKPEPEKGILPSILGGGKGFDAAGLAELLQNPAVQAMIKKGLNSGVATKPPKSGAKKSGKTVKKDGVSDMLGGMDFAQIAKLLQNPMVQSMLKNMF